MDTLNSVEDTGVAIYIQGHQRCVETIPGGPRDMEARAGIAALGPDGRLLSWRSDQPKGIGGYELESTKAGLWSGLDCAVSGETVGGILFRPLQ